MNTKKAKGKGASSSSAKIPANPPSFDQTRFVSTEAEKSFRKIWARKGAAIERRMELGCFGGRYKWDAEFNRRGWVQLTKYEGECVVTLCAEFMANITKADNTQGAEVIETWVRGKRITLEPSTFMRYFGLPREPARQFAYPDIGAPNLSVVCTEILKEGETWDGEVHCEKKKLKDRYLPLYLFSCHSLLPIRRTVDVSVMRAQLLWAIGTGKLIDLPLYMFLQFFEEYKNPFPLGSIPFACMLTELIVDAGSRVPKDMFRVYQESPIDDITINKSRGQNKRRREFEELQKKILQQAEKGVSGESSGSQSSMLEMIQKQGQSLETHIAETRAWEKATDLRLTKMEEQFGKFEERGERMEQAQDRQTTMLQEVMVQLMRWQPSSDDDE